MNTPDLINGLFELSGAIAGVFNIATLLKHKQVRGFAPAVYIYFTSWALWNCFYYPRLDQWFSLAGTISILLSNGIFTGLALYYSRRKHVIQNSTVVRSKGSGRPKESHS